MLFSARKFIDRCNKMHVICSSCVAYSSNYTVVHFICDTLCLHENYIFICFCDLMRWDFTPILQNYFIADFIRSLYNVFFIVGMAYVYSFKQTTALLDLLTTLPTGYFSVLLLNVKITISYSYFIN